MVDIAEVQTSVNRAVSSVFGLGGPGNELESLNSLCSALESLQVDGTQSSRTRSGSNLDNQAGNEDFNEFLENLKRVLPLLAAKVVNSGSLDIKLARSYLRTLRLVTTLLGEAGVAFKGEILCPFVLKVWCSLLCVRGSNQIDADQFKKNLELFDEFIPLILNVYAATGTGREASRLLYIVLEILTQAEDVAHLDQIINSLSRVPDNLKLAEVYPGVVSRLVNKLKQANRVVFLKCVKALVAWLTHFMDEKNRTYNNSGSWLNLFPKNRDEDPLLDKTVESVSYILRRFRRSNPEGVAHLALSLNEYEFLPEELRIRMAESLFECAKKDDLLPTILDWLMGGSLSFKLLMRDIVTRAINSSEGDYLGVFHSYLRLRSCFAWEIDHYLVLRFLIRSVQIDSKGFDRRVVVNQKYLLETALPVQEALLEADTTTESISSLYFRKMAPEHKLGLFSNLLTIFSNDRSELLRLRSLHLVSDLVSSTTQDKSFLTSEAILDLKDVLLGDTAIPTLGEDVGLELVNVFKVRLMDLLTFVTSRLGKGQLSHREVERLLFIVIPEYHSDHIRVSHSASLLLKELTGYYTRFVRPDSQEPGPESMNSMLEYYSNGLVKKLISSLDSPAVPDIVYTLTRFENRTLDLKTAFDITVHLCKYFDHFTIAEGSASELETFSENISRVLYSFNYILMFIKDYFSSSSLEDVKPDRSGPVSEETEGNNAEEFRDDDGKGDFALSIATLMVARTRYYTGSANTKVRYLALLALYRALILTSRNEYIFRIRVHEVWDCLVHALENNLGEFRMVVILLEMLQLITSHVYSFVEKRLVAVFNLLEKLVFAESQIVGVADERNSTVRYKCYFVVAKFTHQVSRHVLNREVFSRLMLISIKLHSPKTCDSIKEALNGVFRNLAKRNPSLVRNVLLEVSKGQEMNAAFIKFALGRDLRNIVGKIPPQLTLVLPLTNFM